MLYFESLSKQNFTQACDFLNKHEAACVNLFGNFVVRGKRVFPTRPDSFFLVYEKNTDSKIEPILCAVFMINVFGLVFHCFDRECLNGAKRNQLVDLLTPVFNRKKLYCIMGEEAGTAFIQSLMVYQCAQEKFFSLFRFNPKSPRSIKTPGENIIVHRCQLADADTVFPLQKAYEVEEVLPPGEAHNAANSLALLRRNLQKFSIYALLHEGIAIAKAGTNAEAEKWVQIGGVYTLPEWRGRGLATFLVRFLAEQWNAQGFGVVLFVNNSNTAAIKVYQKAGFEAVAPYRIVYF